MNSAQEVTDAKRVINRLGTCGDISGCGQPYSRRYQVQKLRGEVTYTITVTGPTPAGYVTLIDGGNPQAVIDTTSTVVNTPVYIAPPPETVRGSDGQVYTLTVSSPNCCSCVS
jgi:hypothetical protein